MRGGRVIGATFNFFRRTIRSLRCMASPGREMVQVTRTEPETKKRVVSPCYILELPGELLEAIVLHERMTQADLRQVAQVCTSLNGISVRTAPLLPEFINDTV
jgi:hypothetical protein